jgi:hypothetical protein
MFADHTWTDLLDFSQCTPRLLLDIMTATLWSWRFFTRGQALLSHLFHDETKADLSLFYLLLATSAFVSTFDRTL